MAAAARARTAWEIDRVDPEWVSWLNKVRLVAVPSRWQVECFRACGVTVPMAVAPLGFDPLLFHPAGEFPEVCTFGTAGALTAGGVRKNAQWVIDLFRKDKVIPPSAPNDGFQEIVAAFKAGKTAMTIHHIGSSKDLVAALGDKVSAVPVPKCDGGQWTSYGDESLAVFSASTVKDAAWKWISFLAEGPNKVAFNGATGQMTVTKSGAKDWKLHERRFVDATVQSLPFARVLPQNAATSEFVNTAWQTAMQRGLTGQTTSQQMMEQLNTLFAQ